MMRKVSQTARVPKNFRLDPQRRPRINHTHRPPHPEQTGHQAPTADPGRRRLAPDRAFPSPVVVVLTGEPNEISCRLHVHGPDTVPG